MKVFFTLTVLILAAVPAVIAAACQYFDHNRFGCNSGIGFRFHHDDPGYSTWKAQKGDAVVHDDGWVFFDGHPLEKTAVMIIQYNGAKKAMVQPPNGMNGWRMLPSRGQHNIANG